MQITQPRVPDAGYAVIDLTQVGISSEESIWSINDRGQILGTGLLSAPFIWEAGERTSVPLQNASKMNNLGEVIGYDLAYPYPGPTRAAKWSAAAGVVSLPVFNPPLEANERIDPSSGASGLNDLGRTVGGGGGFIYGLSAAGSYFNPPPARIHYECGMIWDQSTVEALGPLDILDQTGPGGISRLRDSGGPTQAWYPVAINNSGSIVGNTVANVAPAGLRAFVNTGGATVLLPNVEPGVFAWDINDGASIPGGQTAILGWQGEYDTGGIHPTIWIQTATGWKDKYLGRYNPATQRNESLRGFWVSLNDRLEITGQFHDSDYKTTGQLWQNGKVRNLNPALLKQGWLLTEAAHINNNGAIIGTAMKVSGPGAGRAKKPVVIHQVAIVPDVGMAGVVGDEIPSSKGEEGEKHFVSPKKPAVAPVEIPADYVVLRARGTTVETIQPGPRQMLEWHINDASYGQIDPANPLKFQVKRDATKHAVVSIGPKGGTTATDAVKMNVWIV